MLPGGETHPFFAMAFLLSLGIALPAVAGDLSACTSIDEASARLACYDQASGRLTQESVSPVVDVVENRSGLLDQQTDAAIVLQQDHLGHRWGFDVEDSQDIFKLRPYKPMYLLPVTWTNQTNGMPASPAVDHALSSPVDLNKVEAKFQISLKSRLIRNIWGDNGDLWFGYTQTSRWQVYNHDLSAPFRETNYEPETMLVFRTDYDVLGWRGRMLGLSLNHQSNGRSLPLSRSWNRVIGEVSLERGNWMLSLRPWWRVKERPAEDDNPDISNYIGRGELVVTHQSQGHAVSLLARHSLRTGENSRGSVRLDWAFPISGSLKGHVQVFSGYGESLIDYNHRQTTLGLGLSLMDWF